MGIPLQQVQQVALGDAEDVKIYPVDFSTLEANPGKLLAKRERAAGLELEGFSVVAKDD